MNSPTNNPPADPAAAADRLEQQVLITRLLDGRAGPAEWRAFRDAAKVEEAVWDEVIGQSGDSLLLRCGMTGAGEAVALADARPATLQLVHSAHDGEHADVDRDGRAYAMPRHRRIERLGWLAAAVLGLAFLSSVLKPQGPQNLPGVNSAGIGLPSYNSQELMNKYLDTGRREGRVIGQLPQLVVLDSRPTPDGKGREVLYIRQLVEQAVMEDVYKLGTDDLGRSVLVPAVAPGRPAGGL